MFPYGLLHMDTKVITHQQKLTSISQVWALGTILMTWQELWLIGTHGKRKDDDDDDNEDDDNDEDIVFFQIKTESTVY